MQQPINQYNQYNNQVFHTFRMIDNYIYLYHTDTLVAIPTYPESISDTMGVNFSSVTPLSRSAPIYSYVSSGPRSFSISLNLHRDMMNEISFSETKLNLPELINSDSNESDPNFDYLDIMIKQLQASVLPVYGAAEKMVNPPLIAVKFGSDFFCKGVITGRLQTTYSGPILSNGKYAQVTIDFTMEEIDPYDAISVMSVGSNRINIDLERVWSKK